MVAITIYISITKRMALIDISKLGNRKTTVTSSVIDNNRTYISPYFIDDIDDIFPYRDSGILNTVTDIIRYAYKEVERLYDISGELEPLHHINWDDDKLFAQLTAYAIPYVDEDGMFSSSYALDKDRFVKLTKDNVSIATDVDYDWFMDFWYDGEDEEDKPEDIDADEILDFMEQGDGYDKFVDKFQDLCDDTIYEEQLELLSRYIPPRRIVFGANDSDLLTVGLLPDDLDEKEWSIIADNNAVVLQSILFDIHTAYSRSNGSLSSFREELQKCDEEEWYLSDDNAVSEMIDGSAKRTIHDYMHSLSVSATDEELRRITGAFGSSNEWISWIPSWLRQDDNTIFTAMEKSKGARILMPDAEVQDEDEIEFNFLIRISDNRYKSLLKAIKNVFTREDGSLRVFELKDSKGEYTYSFNPEYPLFATAKIQAASEMYTDNERFLDEGEDGWSTDIDIKARLIIER